MIKKDKIEILIVTMEEDSFEIYHDIDLSTLSRKKGRVSVRVQNECGTQI